MCWYKYNKGKSLGTRGSEQGIILEDWEHEDGARITLEEGGDIAPYSVTIGIYSLMFHTYFLGSKEKGEQLIELVKAEINKIFAMLATPENEQDKTWKTAFDALLNKLIEL